MDDVSQGDTTAAPAPDAAPVDTQAGATAGDTAGLQSGGETPSNVNSAPVRTVPYERLEAVTRRERAFRAETEKQMAALRAELETTRKAPPFVEEFFKRFTPANQPEAEPEFNDPLERELYQTKKELAALREEFGGKVGELSTWREQQALEQQKAAFLSDVRAQWTDATKADPTVAPYEGGIIEVLLEHPTISVKRAIAIFKAENPTLFAAPPAPRPVAQPPAAPAPVPAGKPVPPRPLATQTSTLVPPKVRPKTFDEARKLAMEFGR